jgi:hypothetical protein
MPRRRTFGNRRAATVAVAASAAAALAAAPAALASPTFSANVLAPGSVVVSGSVYDAPSSIITPGVTLLPGCIATATAPLAKSCKPTHGLAIADGTYPTVFNNDTVDGSFGVTSPAYLYDVDRDGSPIRTIPIVVADLGSSGGWGFTETNAYSGNNGRAAIVNSDAGDYYAAGNAGNGSNLQPTEIVNSAGAQFIPASLLPEADQTPGDATPIGSFNITQLGDTADKLGKDTNFRGLTIFDNVVYFTKGSGGKGINTVYFIDTTGTACPNGRWAPRSGRCASHRADHVQQLQHVHPRGLQHDARDHRHDRLPVRDLVCQSRHALCRPGGCRERHLRPDHEHLHGRGDADHRRPAEVGLRWDEVEFGLHRAERAESRDAVRGARLTNG